MPATSCATREWSSTRCSVPARRGPGRRFFELLDLNDGAVTDISVRYYNAGTDTLIEAIAALPDDCRTALLVGHAPAVPGLVHELCDEATSHPEAFSSSWPTGSRPARSPAWSSTAVGPRSAPAGWSRRGTRTARIADRSSPMVAIEAAAEQVTILSRRHVGSTTLGTLQVPDASLSGHVQVEPWGLSHCRGGLIRRDLAVQPGPVGWADCVGGPAGHSGEVEKHVKTRCRHERASRRNSSNARDGAYPSMLDRRNGRGVGSPDSAPIGLDATPGRLSEATSDTEFDLPDVGFPDTGGRPYGSGGTSATPSEPR